MSFLPPEEVVRRRLYEDISDGIDRLRLSEGAVRVPADSYYIDDADSDGQEMYWSKSAGIAFAIDENDSCELSQGELVVIRGLTHSELERVNAELVADGEMTV